MAFVEKLTLSVLIVVCLMMICPSTTMAQEGQSFHRGVPIGSSAKGNIPKRAGKKAKVPAKAYKTDIERRLDLAGLPTTDEALLRWMTEGLNGGQSLRQSPDLPKEHAQLGVDAIALFGVHRCTESVPTLIEIAAGRIPVGLAQLIEMDIMRMVSDERELYRTKATKIFQYNAVVSLGLIGDTRALPVVMASFRGEESAAARLQFANSVVLLGGIEGLDWLVTAVGSDEKRLSTAAARCIYILTGEDFGLTAVTSLAKRKTIAEKYTRWWKGARSSFQLDLHSVEMRRNAPVLESHGDESTLRGRLRVCSQYVDPKSLSKSPQYRSQLIGAGTAINHDLETLILDKYEDVDIRMEALNVYYEINRQTSRTRATMRKFLEKAGNVADHEVAEKARLLKLTLESDYKKS